MREIAGCVASGLESKLGLVSLYYFRLSAISVERFFSSTFDYGKYTYIERSIDGRRRRWWCW